jgi:GR25 family glycosyltransferase involved in LPS biosynthesis
MKDCNFILLFIVIVFIIILIIDLKNNNKFYENFTKSNKEVVVITCNFGNYDLNENNILQLNNNNLFDWIYFSDSKINSNGYLNIIDNYFPETINILNNDKNRMKCKFYKFKSINFNFMKNYKYIIWMDASIIIENKNFVNDVISIIQNNLDIDLFLFEHYKRKTIYEEYIESKDYPKYNNQNLKGQIEFYKSIGFIDNNLFESGFLIYKNNNKIINMMNDWWNETLKYGYQCQISLPFVIFKNKINFKLLNENNFTKGKLDGSIWKNKLFGRVKLTHQSDKEKVINFLNDKKPYEIYNLKPNLNNFNFISGIVWINLDRSPDRREYMINLLKDINIPNFRISAIDGKSYDDIESIYKNIPLERKLSKSEIACTLSHIKAINYLKNIPGEYFIVCENDISFNNIILFDHDLKTIILDCPKFDILMLNKTFLKPLKEKYSKWNDYFYNKYEQVGSTVCYVISRNGINKIINNAKYIDDNNFILNKNNNLDVADIYIYKNIDTYIYKYNYITTLIEQSTIHNNHMDLHKNNDNFQFGIILKDFYNYDL